MKSKGDSAGAADSKPHQYDVFINHRGPDVKKTLVAHLDAALRRDGFWPFLDGKDIGQGRHIFNSIDKALKGACVHVAIFSKRYAESKYCLNELCEMLNSGKAILPVFYHVSPLDLRWIENGPFKQGFEKHALRGRTEEIQKWKDALCKVADYRGFRLDEVNGDEWQLIRSILVQVRNAIPATLLPGKEQYGMEGSIKAVLKTLESVSVLGLVGMGGIGKTTLATGIYNHFVGSQQFERYCFLRDVRSSEPSQLQRKLMHDLGHGCELQILSPEDYNRVFDGLMCQRVLVVVDDIDHSSQFEALIPGVQKLGCGSRVVITSRRRDVLKHAMAAAPSQEVYEVPLLNECDSRRLFNRHAFLSDTASEGFVEVAANVADACGGHALSLETIGASLFDKNDLEDREIWLEAVKALQENDDIFGKLRSSYESLPSDGDRTMFQDIACMLIGVEKDVALTAWKSCNSPQHHCSSSNTPASTGLRRLMDRSLVKLDEEGRLRMHDVLRDMGRDIVKKEGGRAEQWTHMWDASAATKVLGCRKRNNRTRGMSLGVSADMTFLMNFLERPSIKVGAVSCDASDLTGMEELHLLVLNGCDVVVPDDFSSWPQELRWLQWRAFCFASLPAQLNLPNLVVLDLSDSNELTRLWENDAHVQLPVLQTLDLRFCERLEELGENVGQSVPKLKRLEMYYCSKLRRLPDSIGHLTGLEHLDLRCCGELVCLPDAIVGLVSLRSLLLQCCRNLQQLPEELGKLINVETLDVSFCETLSKLPASIVGLRVLKTLRIGGTRVMDLPVRFDLLTSLTSLSMGGLNCSFRGLYSLPDLFAVGGSADMGDLGALSALQVLDLSNHARITALPKSLGNLKRLVRLGILECPELLTVEALPDGLEDLRVSVCWKLTEIPSLAAMRCLMHLNLKDCGSLRHVRGLECLTTVETINVSGCTSIEGWRINGMMNSALRECDVRGSKVGVAYNNRWLEREPAVQSICYSGDEIPVLCSGMGPMELLLPKGEWRLVLEATISSKAECIALIWCLAIKKLGWLEVKVKVWRGGQLVMESKMSGYANSGVCNQVYLCTLRREHHVVQALQLGDQICVYLKSHIECCIVVEGGVCFVCYEDEKWVLVMNSEELSKSLSHDLVEQFGQLVLEDEYEDLEYEDYGWVEDQCDLEKCAKNIEWLCEFQSEDGLWKRQRTRY